MDERCCDLLSCCSYCRNAEQLKRFLVPFLFTAVAHKGVPREVVLGNECRLLRLSDAAAPLLIFADGEVFLCFFSSACLRTLRLKMASRIPCWYVRFGGDIRVRSPEL
jgi:hypothetical protein